MTLSRFATLSILGLAAASVVITEVLLTRVLSLAAYYGLAFAILSLAMLGLSAGSLHALRAQERREPVVPWLARRLLLFAGGIVLATLAATSIPLSLATTFPSFVALLAVAGAAAMPMMFGGSIVARILGASEIPLSSLYAVDLIAAGVGALAPLVLLGPLSGPSALIATAMALALASAAISRGNAAWSGGGLAILALAAIVVTETTSRGIVVRYPKGHPRPIATPFFEAWNPLSYVALEPFGTYPASAVLWAASPMTPEGTQRAAMALIDGDAGTLVHGYSDLSSLDILRFDATSVVHRLRSHGTACVVGVGGGRDLLSALVYGHEHVFGVEVNSAIVRMMEKAADVSPLLRDPRVRVVVGDGRAELARPGVSCSVLQATLVDTWAATSAGAFAHTETTIYTLEAWRLFLERVAPDGIVSFSRWYDAPNVEETARLVSLATASLLDRGVAHPRDHIALVTEGAIATILVSPSPFTAADRAVLGTLQHDLAFSVVLGPDQPSRGWLLDRLVDAPTIDSLASYGTPTGLDTSPPTDDRPFFFQLRTASAWLHPLDAVRERSHGGVLAGNAAAMLQLLTTVFVVLILGGAMLGPTLVRAARSSSPQLPGARAAIYFGCLGAGFMMAEIALVQRMHVVLGHPSYALIVVLAGLLFATGLGSAISPRVLTSRKSVGVAALVAALLLAALPYAVIGPMARASVESGLLVRAAWAGGCSALVGLLLGMLFPSGMRYVARDTGAPAALAINGFTSVLGSATAIVLSVWAGIPATFVAAGAIYLIAAIAGPARWAPLAGPGDDLARDYAA